LFTVEPYKDLKEKKKKEGRKLAQKYRYMQANVDAVTR
jgi:hypothetical protein